MRSSCENVIQHLLETLPVAGDNYLVVFKLIHDLCFGELTLSQSDVTLLSKQLELGLVKQEEEEETGKGSML